jgi:hypothetical protein
MELTLEIKIGKKVIRLKENEMQELYQKLKGMHEKEYIPYTPYYPWTYPSTPYYTGDMITIDRTMPMGSGTITLNNQGGLNE